MIKKEIISQLLERTDLSRSQATKATEAIVDILREAIENGDEIFLRGFGTFKIIERKARPVRNITKNETMFMPAHKVVKFVLSSNINIKE